ncbi:MAG: T9SS type A sorting domain-containing protein, partial [Melioribacteraceae bacterium]|nr:T9SS type A sorting domain-containing protein [Melioribacteraceae bacterium]MCF8420885.1 T9SS type A sorting domain-containing protein [Melioribacteraceae bacterium]
YNKVFVRMNNGIGGFLDEISYTTSEYVHRCASADLDGNGYNDIVSVHYLHAYLENNLHVLFNDGTGNFVEDPVTGINENNAQPTEFTLYQNYPNPFNGTTNISFYLPSDLKISLIIYDITGKEVVRLIDDERLPEGKNQVEWNSKNKLGQNVSSGVYLYSLRVHNTEITKKMVVVE